MKRLYALIAFIILIIIAKIFNFYDLIKENVLRVKSPIKIAYLYKGIINDDVEVAYIENDYYLTCLEDGVVSYIGNNQEYNDYIIVSTKTKDYLYYNLEKIDIYLYKYLKKNDIISLKENTGVLIL